MVDINTGLLLGGVAEQRNTDRDLGLRERAVGVQENQLQFQQRVEQRNQAMEAITNTTDQAVQLIQSVGSRDEPGFANTLGQIRANVESLARSAQAAGIGITTDNVLQTFDSAVLSTQTRNEVAQAEAQAAVAGAGETVSGIQSIPESQQAQVSQLLGITEPRQTQEFFGLLGILEDPNASPVARQLASERINFISSRATSPQFTIQTTPDGGVTVTQGGEPAAPARQTLTGKQLDDLRAARDIVTRGTEIATSLIESDTPFGALGSARAGAQTFSGVVSDLTGIPLQDITTEFEALLSELPPESRETFSVGQVDAAEGILTFAVARAIQGDSNRLLAGSINAAKNMVQLTGLTSDEQVRDRLSTVAQFLTSQNANFQRRFDQGVTGGTDTAREPALSEPSGGADTESKLIEDIDRLLGESGG